MTWKLDETSVHKIYQQGCREARIKVCNRCTDRRDAGLRSGRKITQWCFHMIYEVSLIKVNGGKKLIFSASTCLGLNDYVQ